MLSSPPQDAPSGPVRPAPELLSVVVPCHNESSVLAALISRLAVVLEAAGQPFEIVLVNDGSTDDSLTVMSSLAAGRSDITLVNLSRNFGKEIALTAGLGHAVGDAVVVIDADLQDPPEVIPKFVSAYRQGYDIAYGRRLSRQGETWTKKATARLFYRLMRNVGPVPLPENVGDFRLMSRRAVDALLRLPESHRFMKGLFAWIGFPSTAVDYDRHPRLSGRTSWNYWKLVDLSIEGITSFTILPLRLIAFLGVALALIAFGFGAYFFVRTLFFGDSVQGFPTLIVTILLLGGTQLIALGVIGEYLGRVFNETKRRPLYFLENVTWSAAGRQRSGTPPSPPLTGPE